MPTFKDSTKLQMFQELRARYKDSTKPEILKMHLEILYKTVNLVSEQKIIQGLDAFKEKKEKLRLEEQQRQLDTKSKKKQRIKQSAQKDKELAANVEMTKDEGEAVDGDVEMKNLEEDLNGNNEKDLKEENEEKEKASSVKKNTPVKTKKQGK